MIPWHCPICHRPGDCYYHGSPVLTEGAPMTVIKLPRSKPPPKVHRWDFYISVRKDGRVLVAATAPSLLLGHVRYMAPHGSRFEDTTPGWYWSRDGFQGEVQGEVPGAAGGFATRKLAVRGLLEALATAAR